MVLAPATTGPARVALSGGATTGLLGGSRSSRLIDGVTLEEAACRSAQAPEVLHAEGHGPLALLRVPLTWFASACSPAAGLAPCVWTVASPCGRPGPSAAGPSAVPGRGEELGVTRVSAMAWLPGLKEGGDGVGLLLGTAICFPLLCMARSTPTLPRGLSRSTGGHAGRKYGTACGVGVPLSTHPGGSVGGAGGEPTAPAGTAPPSATGGSVATSQRGAGSQAKVRAWQGGAQVALAATAPAPAGHAAAA